MQRRASVLGLAMIISLPLLACSAGANPIAAPDVPPRPEEPSPRPFRGVAELTPEARTLLSQRISGSGGQRSVAELKQQIVRSLLEFDVNGNGLSKADFYDIGREQLGASNANAIGQIFQSDYNGDGLVTKAEFDKTVERQRLRQVRQYEATRAQYPDREMPANAFSDTVLRAQTQFRNADRDRDNTISLLEAYWTSAQNAETAGLGTRNRQDAVFALDFNQDGLVTGAEIEAGIDLFVKEAEEAGVVFPAESQVSQRPGLPPSPPILPAAKREALACNVQKPSDNAVVVRLSAYEGKQLSNISVAGQDKETTTSEVRIEAGNEPLYIVASTYEGHIWRFVGATSRIEHVVLSAWQTNIYGQPAVGLTGLPRQKMSAIGANCVGGFFRNLDAAALFRTLGRGTDIRAESYGLSGIALPSKAEYALPPVRPRQLIGDRLGVENAWQDFLRYAPGGIYTLDRASVVSNIAAEPYRIFPHQAGVTQLLVSGAIEPGNGGFVVRQAITLPGGMHGGHSATFIVPRGVPKPSGDRSHNCIRVEGEAPVGAVCGAPTPIAPPAPPPQSY